MFRDQILPLLITQVLPPAEGGSMDSPGVAIASDGRQYVLKVQTADRFLLPATESLCASLATACQLPVAASAWLKFDNGAECYGSKLEGGIVRTLADTTFLRRTPIMMQSMKRRWQRCDNRAAASGHYALDLFLFNYDRHLYNYLFQEMGSRLEVMGIDYSRAFWMIERDPGALPDPAAMALLDKKIERTVRAGRIVRRWIGFDIPMAHRTLAILKVVPVAWIENFCKDLPSNWMTDADRATLIAWWNSPARIGRIDALHEGLTNGSLL